MEKNIEELEQKIKDLEEENKALKFELAFDEIGEWEIEQIIKQMAKEDKRLIECDSYYIKELVNIIDEFGFEYVEMKFRTKAEEYKESEENDRND